MNRPPSLVLLAAIVAAVAVPPASADDLEDALRSHWLGSWVTTNVETYSACDGGYSNNDVNGTRVTSRHDLAFAAGELARVDKVNLKSSRVDVYLAIAEPLRVARQEGPFTLYDDRPCRVQLLVDVVGKEIRAGNLAAVEAAIAAAITAHSSRAAATVGPAWNHRITEPLPPEYQETLYRYETWKVEQVNARLAEKREDAVDQADRVLDRLDDDPGYLDGFAEGVRASRNLTLPGCESVATVGFATYEKDPPKDHRDDSSHQRRWRHGFRDGQVLAYNLALARAVERCFLVPPPPFHRPDEVR